MMPLSPAVFYHNVVPFGPTGSAESLAKRSYLRSLRAGRPGDEKTDYRHRLLLRTERAGCCE